MNRRSLLICALAATGVVPVAIFLLDLPVARLVDRSGLLDWHWMGDSLAFLDLITGREISKWLLGFALVLVGLALLPPARTRGAAVALLFVGTVQLSSTLVNGVGKNVFGRLRPYEMSGADSWFAGGESFPSGHMGAFAGLFLPLMVLFPKWRWPLLAVPLFVGVTRVGLNHHFVSDVIASVAVASALTLVGAALWRR